MLRLTFLGTGTSQGVPIIACNCEVCISSNTRDKRLRSSVMIESKTTRIIIDSGPDFRQQMLRKGICSIDAILLTHEHTDHIIGIDDVRAFNHFCKKSINVFATEQVQKVLKKDFDYAFADFKYPGVPEITLQTIDNNTPFMIGDLEITPILGKHHMLPVTGFRVAKLAYLTDFNHIEDSELEKLNGVECFIVNALRFEPHISHFNIPQAIELCMKVGAKQNYLTHLSHHIGVHTKTNKQLPENINLAYDGLTIDA